ncbi:nitroreductase family protein [Stygiolobus caldivivus]|uniref:NADH dehydrogenase n=1 Tax=Stygiolobus caldivivus TaxID=2824673 RepID=A0A8D5U7L8_9CREN|nr:nitroreductase family protein [Stygiolobus caldivivus]BCU70269.1 NADH dehydrogenase [Stygiolobus caldivivus]
MNSIIDFLIERRSIRKFRSEPVKMELIKELIRVANYAPNSNNREPWKFIVITDDLIKRELSTLHKGASHIAEAPVGIAVVAEPDVSPETWMIDTANATLYFVLAAYSVGLGVGWIAAYENKKAKELLKIPQDKVLMTLLSLGYPDPTYQPRHKDVKRPEEVLFKDYWGSKML